MTRSLPWKKDAVTRPRADVLRADSPARTPVASRSSSPKVTPSGSLAVSASKTKTVSRLSLSAKRERSPSTSPPPEPPVESFMVEGAENDDHWRMVEDEFLSVANTFTVHLHAAEYHRLNSLAKEQNADTINSISRPVTGVMTSSVKRRQDAVARLAKQHSGLKRARSNVDEPPPDDDDRTPWTGTSLHRLMDSPRKKSMRLTSVTSAVPATRAAAGYLGSSPSNGSGRFTDALSNTAPRPRAPVKQIREESETSDDGDDLDGPVHRQPAFPASSSSAVSHRISHHRPSNMNLDTNSEAPEQVESDNPDGGLFLRSIRERRQRQGNRWRTSSDGVTVKEERRD